MGIQNAMETSNVEYLLDLEFNLEQGNPLLHIKGKFEMDSKCNWIYLPTDETDALHKAIAMNPRMLTGIESILVGNFSISEKRAEKIEPELVIKQAPPNANAVLRSKDLLHVPMYPQIVQYRSAIYYHIDSLQNL